MTLAEYEAYIATMNNLEKRVEDDKTRVASGKVCRFRLREQMAQKSSMVPLNCPLHPACSDRTLKAQSNRCSRR